MPVPPPVIVIQGTEATGVQCWPCWQRAFSITTNAPEPPVQESSAEEGCGKLVHTAARAAGQSSASARKRRSFRGGTIPRVSYGYTPGDVLLLPHGRARHLAGRGERRPGAHGPRARPGRRRAAPPGARLLASPGDYRRAG